jgi:hypothetical protein
MLPSPPRHRLTRTGNGKAATLWGVVLAVAPLAILCIGLGLRDQSAIVVGLLVYSSPSRSSRASPRSTIGPCTRPARRPTPTPEQPSQITDFLQPWQGALILTASVVVTCYLLGVSTRRMDKLVSSLGITSLSKSQVPEMAKELDAAVAEFRTRSLAEAGPFTFVAADALVLKVRAGGRVVPSTPSSRPG